MLFAFPLCILSFLGAKFPKILLEARARPSFIDVVASSISIPKKGDSVLFFIAPACIFVFLYSFLPHKVDSSQHVAPNI
jgi:hypothetical protein